MVATYKHINGVNRLRKRVTNGPFNCFAKEPQAMSIHTGLSVTVAGHLIALDRNETTLTAKVVVTVINGHNVTGLEQEAVKLAADLLAERARRFLGLNWTVIPYNPPRDYAKRGA